MRAKDNKVTQEELPIKRDLFVLINKEGEYLGTFRGHKPMGDGAKFQNARIFNSYQAAKMADPHGRCAIVRLDVELTVKALVEADYRHPMFKGFPYSSEDGDA